MNTIKMHCVSPWHFLKDLLILIYKVDTILENQSTDISNRNKHILFVIVGGHKGMWDAMFAIKGTQR